MKYLFALMVILYSIAGYSQLKETYFVGAGANLNKVKGVDIDFGNSIGYYANFGLLKEVGSHLDAMLEAQYQNQHSKISKVDVNINTISLGFYMKAYPIKRNTSIIGGFQLGFVGSSKIENTELKLNDKGFFALSAGLSHRIEKIEFIARMNHITSDTFFQNTIQAGINYHF